MWEIGLVHQLTGSLYAFAVGVFFCFVYDILKAYCLIKKFGTVAVFVKDVIFSLFAAFVTFMLLMARSNGEVRGYILFFIAVGFVLFKISLSRFWVRFLSFVFLKLYKFNSFLSDLLSKFCDILDNFESAVLKFLKKYLKKHQNL